MVAGIVSDESRLRRVPTAGRESQVYGAGTLTYVEAGTVYGYEVLEDAKILILFDRSPGMNYR